MAIRPYRTSYLIGGRYDGLARSRHAEEIRSGQRATGEERGSEDESGNCHRSSCSNFITDSNAQLNSALDDVA